MKSLRKFKAGAKISQIRWAYAAWLFVIGCFAILHAVHLRADFPNHSPWIADWAKYTDEGWYGNAAVRAHLFGSWHVAGDFNPAVAGPVWPFLEWVLFIVTGVSLEAARGLAIALFFASLLLSYKLLRARGPRWVGLLAVTLLVTNPFLYCFSRLAILEPLLTTLMLTALNVAIRLPRLRAKVFYSCLIGLLFTLMMLTKATAIFLAPAVGWAMLLPLWPQRRAMLRCGAAAFAASVASFGLWMYFVVREGLFPDYEYLFFVNHYVKPTEFYWPLVSLAWSLHGALWADRILIPLGAAVVVFAAFRWRSARGRRLWLDPVFGASVLAIGGYVIFMALQNHPQPRYFAVVSYFAMMVVARGAEVLLEQPNHGAERFPDRPGFNHARLLGFVVVGCAALAASLNGMWTLTNVLHPEYTFVDAAERLTRYMDEHPNGNQILLSVSGDEISLATHVRALNDLFATPAPGIPDMGAKLVRYRPGWLATWNTLDPGTLEDVHCFASVEQVATFRAFDDPTRDVLVLFKLHPWPGDKELDPGDEKLNMRFPEDKFEVPLR